MTNSSAVVLNLPAMHGRAQALGQLGTDYCSTAGQSAPLTRPVVHLCAPTLFRSTTWDLPHHRGLLWLTLGRFIHQLSERFGPVRVFVELPV